MSDTVDDTRASNGKRRTLTVVGIGASAGGLAALKEFFKHVPEDSGLAFVVVVHLSPEHESHLAELLQPHVSVPVQQVTDTLLLEADRVYVIPPGRNLDAIDTHLRLSPLEERRAERAPIDHFFKTLAKTHDGHSIGVVLTGTGSDGTLGIREIKEQAGLVIVQDPNEAEYDGMPQSAIATGLVDVVLPLAEIPDAVLRYAHTRPRVAALEGEDLEAEERQVLHKVFAQVRSVTGRDFSRYKRSTILRRIARRMQLHQVEEIERYLDVLRESTDEVRALADDLLINVTSFFRDPDVFERLAADIVPDLLEGRGPDESVRVWSVGCATGEEAYSLAILLLEEAARRESPPTLQVFASDLHEHSLARARDGFYPGDIATDVSPERLQRFFTKEDGGYRIRKTVREMVVFAPHNLLLDPPFSKLDLVSCRNLLIYLERSAQNDIIELFHYALRPDGVLVLGSSETTDSADLFRVEDKRLCLYRRRNVPGPEPRLPVFPVLRSDSSLPRGEPVSGLEPRSFGVLHERMVERYAPPSLLVGPDDRVAHVSERAGRYLAHPGGVITANVFQLVRPELRAELRSALHQARESQEPAMSGNVAVDLEGDLRPVRLDVRLATGGDEDGYALVIFDERPGPEVPVTVPVSDAGRALEAERDLARQRLQALVEEYETSQEEMKASNEELQSTNEELRSTLEELETSKEELQSMNEELQTVNQENRHKVEELAQLSGDLQNLLSATDIATLFLDRQLRILRYTPKVNDLFSIRPADRGRPLSDLTDRLVGGTLQADARRVLDTLIPIERELCDDDGNWYLTRMLAYRSVDDRIEGVVVTFVEITRRKLAEDALRESEAQLRTVLDGVPVGIVLCDATGKLIYGNPEVEHVFEHPFRPSASPDHYGEWPVLLPDADEPYPIDRMPIARTVATGETVSGEEMRIRRPDGTLRTILVNSQPILDAEGAISYGASAFVDVTERREAEAALRKSEEQYRLLVESATEYAIMMLDPSGAIVSWNPGAERIFGLLEEDIVGQPADVIFTEEDRAAGVPQREMATAAEAGQAADDRWHLRADGSRFWANGVMTVLRDDDGRLRGFAKVLRDNTLRKSVEDALRASEERFRQAVEAADMGTWIFDVGSEVLRFDDRARAIFGLEDEDVSQETVMAVIHPADLEGFIAARDHSLDPNSPDTFSQTHRVVLPDGEVRWVRGQARVFFEGEDTERRPVRVVGVVLDVTDQREAEVALRESEMRFREVAETVPDILFTTTPDGTVDYVNPRFEMMMGRPPEEARGTKLWPYLVVPEDQERTDVAWTTAREAGDPFEIRHRLLTGGGDQCWVIMRARPICDPEGRVSAWVGTVTDVDELTRAAAEVRELNATLEARVEERTGEVRQLAAALTVAEQEERQRIAHVLHDDLQQRLHGLSMLLAQAIKSEGAAADRLLLRSAEVLDQATTLTRTLSTELSPAVLDSERFEDALGWLADQKLEQYGLIVEVRAEGAPRVSSPAIRVLIYRIIRELLFNVVKHSGVDRALVVLEGDGEEVVIRVEDDGAGFEMGDGLQGFGLTSVRDRLELIGGRFEVESSVGQGTRATIVVPSEPA